mmetsp:Transcript_41333/g.82764  ORF Transcript_41333/g.82764 Transcript_41333/m.82764 type:complete len:95 (+) Transcript_41333:103-387(+)
MGGYAGLEGVGAFPSVFCDMATPLRSSSRHDLNAELHHALQLVPQKLELLVKRFHSHAGTVAARSPHTFVENVNATSTDGIAAMAEEGKEFPRI